jgi:hypothetical protein
MILLYGRIRTETKGKLREIPDPVSLVPVIRPRLCCQLCHFIFLESEGVRL